MPEEAGEWRRSVQVGAGGCRLVQRHRGHEEQRGGADGGKKRRKRHGLEEEEAVAAERIRMWVRIVRPHGSLWTVELQRTLIAMAVNESTRDADYVLMWQQRCMQEQEQAPLQNSSAWMEPLRRKQRRIWHDPESGTNCSSKWLPFHLILGRLPVRQLFQLRSVCKPWDLMLEAGEVQLDTNVKKEEYWFVMFKPGTPSQNVDFMVFSSHCDGQGRKDWPFFRLPLPSQSHSKLFSLLGGPHCTHLCKFSQGECHGMPRLVSTGGLMCAFVCKPGTEKDDQIIVFNCLTGSVKVLPSPANLFGQMSARHPWTKFAHMHMAIDDVDPTRYYIMLTHESLGVDPGYFVIFDSRIGRWKVGRSPEEATTAKFSLADGDFFHYVSPFPVSFAPRPTLFAYHASDDVWSKVKMPHTYIKNFGIKCSFLKWKGRLLQAVRVIVTSHNERICLGFVVRELRMVKRDLAVWVVVARTPQHLWHWLPYSK